MVAIAKIDAMTDIDGIVTIRPMAAMLSNNEVTFSLKRAVEVGQIADFCMMKMTDNHHWIVDMNVVAADKEQKRMIGTIEAVRTKKFVLRKDFTGMRMAT